MAKDYIQLQFSTEEVNLILEGLGAMPFAKVFAVIGKIHQQVAGQINSADDASEAKTQAD